MVFAVDGKAMHGTTQSNGRSPDIVDLIRGNGHDYFIALKANQKEVRWSVEDEQPKMKISKLESQSQRKEECLTEFNKLSAWFRRV